MSKAVKCSAEELQEFLEVALTAAKAAGELILENIGGAFSSQTKLNATDIQTQVDRECEQLIVARIRARFPTHHIVAEECWSEHSHSEEYFSKASRPVWFVDPIDGTTNFVHSLPFVCVLIGVRVGGEAVVGVCHAPVLRQTFHAVKGGGAWLNASTRIRSTDNAQLSKAVCLTEFGFDRSKHGCAVHCQRIQTLLSAAKVRGIRSFGSCGMSMVNVAIGNVDLYFEGRDETFGPKPWDFTAPEIIVTEAGGCVLLPEGAAFDCRRGRVLCAANEALAAEFLKLKLYKTPAKL